MNENFGGHTDDKPESGLHRKMRENCRFFLLFAAVAGAAYPALFCEAGGIGINVPVFALIWLGCMRASLGKLELWDGRRLAPYICGIILLALSASMTMNEFVQMVDIAGIVILMCMTLLVSFCETRQWQFGKFFIAADLLIYSGFTRLPEPVKHLLGLRKNSDKKAGGLRHVLLGLAVSIPLCAVVLALLMSADIIFRELVNRLFDWDLGLQAFFRTAFKAVVGFAAVFFGFYCTLSGQAAKPVSSEVKAARVREPLAAITFTGILAVIYIVFCAIQVIYLFAGRGLPEGFTYAGYARQGFFQLLFVGILNFLLVTFCSWKFRRSRALKLLLTVISACTYILIASSAYRMLLYVDVYGLTFLRIIVLWFLGVLAILMTGTVVSIYRSGLNLFRFALFVCLALWLCFSFAKPDRIAARYNAETFGLTEGTVGNMLHDLSMDAVPVMAKYDYNGEFRDEWNAYLGGGVENAYRRHGVRSFNFALWEAERSVT